MNLDSATLDRDKAQGLGLDCGGPGDLRGDSAYIAHRYRN